MAEVPIKIVTMDGIRGLTLDESNAIFARLMPVASPKDNAEKGHDIYKKVVPYMPEIYHTDAFYTEPTVRMSAVAADTKAQRKKAAVKRKATDSSADTPVKRAK